MKLLLFSVVYFCWDHKTHISSCDMGRHQTKTCNVFFKAMRNDYLKRHMMRRDHLHGNMIRHEQENEDNVVTLGERLYMAAKILLLYNEFEYDSSGENDRQSVDRDEKSEGGEDQSETSDESGEDDDSNEDEDNVDVENRDDQSDMSN